MRPLFVTGAGTDCGKTLAGCALIGAARAAGLAVDAFKPVLSGYDPRDPAASDAGRLLAALGRPVEDAEIDAIAPLRFAAPLSPPDAAAREGAVLPLETLAALCLDRLAAAERSQTWLLIEGAGGVMSPIADDGLNIDLMVRLGAPLILCADKYLGTISHSLTALEALKARGLRPVAVVLQALSPGAPDLADTVRALTAYGGGVPILSGPAWPERLLALCRA